METGWAPAREPQAQRVWKQVLRPLAAQMQACAPELAADAVARMRAELPDRFPDEQTVTENIASTEASIRQLAQIIADGADPACVELPPLTVAIARAGVQRQVALADLMRFYRLGQERVWQWMCSRIAAQVEDVAEMAAALELGTGWLFGYADVALVLAERAYEAEREAWAHSTAAARGAAIDDIIGERQRDTQEASKRLRYNINRNHIAVMAWLKSVPEDRDPQGILAETVSILGRAVAAESTLIHPAGSLAAAGWLSRQAPFSGDELGVEKTVGTVLALPHGVLVAVGEPGSGLAGFRRSHIEASHARRVVSLAGPHASILTPYRDVAVAALASVDAEHAASFVHRVLGPLAADDEATYRLAMTLSVYLQENRSRARAAQRLIVHPNTVSYRVQQAESILGRSIGADTLDLAVALTLLPTLPGLTHPGPANL